MTLDLIKIRRDLHQIPEIGLEEFKTQAYLLERISEMTEGKDFVDAKRTCVQESFCFLSWFCARENYWLAYRY